MTTPSVRPSLLPALRSLVASGAALTFLSTSALAAVRYVDGSLASGLNDGTSWDNAYQGVGGLATALTAAVAGDEIWVKQGTYKPTTTASRTISFNLKNGVSIYGGFAGGETMLGERDPSANVTTLTGDLAGNDPTITDNSYHVIRGNSANATAVLDGFTITAGNANGPTAADNDKGGGALMISSSNGTIRQCIFVGNRCTFGGGACYVRQSSPTYLDCTFENNIGGSFGGAFDIATNANPVFDRCLVRGNTAARAGGIEIFGNSQPKVTNTVVTNNTATGASGGGGFYIASSSVPTIRNCTIAFNKGNVTAGGILNTGSTTSLGNCIVWGNSGPGGVVNAANQISGAGVTATYSTIQFGFAGAGNSAVDPQFVDAATFDLHVLSTSPTIDAGNNALVPAGTLTDLDGMPRFVDIAAVADTGLGTPPIVDRGAYETQPAPPACPADLDGNGIVDGADLGVLLAAWGTPDADITGEGVTDGADLGVMLAAWGPCSG